MENVILSPIDLNTLLEKFSAIVDAKVEAQFKSLEDKEVLLSPAEACKVFSPAISKVTLNSWSSQDLLKKHYLGGRTYYKRSEIIEAAKHLKRYKKA